MVDSRIGAAPTALDTLGIVDLSEPGPSSSHAMFRGHRSTALSQRSDDHTNETLGLPPDAQVIRVPEGETYRVRAVYDFAATDESALSFHAGDVIEVLTMLPSGWWDGMLGTSRGWFPSNYVEDVDDADLDGEEDVDGYGNYNDKHYMQRNGATDMLGLEERGGWNNWGGADNEPSLDDLAHEVMAGREREASRDSGAVPTRADADPNETARRLGAEREEVWVPSLTPDGRLYYHNTLTGEESWSIPGGEPQLDISANTSQNGDAASEAGGERYGATRASRRPSASSSGGPVSAQVMGEEFRPPHARGGQSGVPHPWVARLSDDGRSWYYYNQSTGETRRDPPPASNRAEGADASRAGAHGASAGGRTSGPNRRTKDWEDRIRSSLAPLYAAPQRPTLVYLMDAVHDAITQVYDAALAGVQADEELAVARSTHTGLALAIQHEEGAVEDVSAAIQAVVTSVRNFVVAFGYVGPVIPPPRGNDSTINDESMERPPWAGDMSLVGSLGLIQYMTHIAITASRSEPGSNPWGAVVRAATKLRAVIDGMPHIMFTNVAPEERTGVKGRRLAAWFGTDALGDFMSGRFGFGPSTDVALRPLNAETVADVQKLQTELTTAIAAGATADDGGVLDIIRATSRFRDAVSRIDVAVAIDLDGDLSDMAHPTDSHHEDVRAYADLVSKARHALHELDETALQLDSAAADVYLRWDSPASVDSTHEELGQTVEKVFGALNSLFNVAQQQATMLEQGHVRGSLGARSPSAITRRAASAHGRKQSQMSLESHASGHVERGGEGHDRQGSGTSTGSRRTRSTGAEAEFLEGDDTTVTNTGGKRRSHRLSRTSQSASASQTSLVNAAPRQSSSTTSLPYGQESESGSTRGSNRASILKAVPGFLRRDDAGSKMKSGKKLAKLLGDDSIGSRLGSIPSGAAPAAPPPPVPAPMSAPPAAAIRTEPAWYLNTDYPPGEIVFDDKGCVRAGTIRALVVRLTTHVSYDNAFFQEFLLTFRSFVSPADLIELLIERYTITPPEGLQGEQLQEWQLRKQTPVRLRVANTLKAWLDNHYYEKEDLHALDLIEDFAKNVVPAGSELISRQLQQLVERKRRGDDAQSRRVLTSGSQPAPLPLAPRTQTGRPLQLLDIPALEIARQLTIMESQYFQRIKPSECLHKAWQSDAASEVAPNVGYVIFTANRLAGWIGLSILRVKDVKVRATVIKHFIRVGTDLRKLNNFSSMAGVVAGLSSSPISRLKKTWELLPEKTIREWRELERAMDSTKNFSKYKEMLKTTNPPCVPFLGFYLSALVFIEDGNRDMVPAPQQDGSGSVPMTPTASQTSMPRRPSNATTSTGMSRQSTAWSNGTGTTANGEGQHLLINFFKRHMTADILRDIQQYQSLPYNLAMSPTIAKFIEEGLDDVANEKEDLYDISLAVEPKETAPPR